jgi:hypothetical protein
MKSSIIRFFLFVITLLTLNLITGLITNWALCHNIKHDPLKATAIGMLLITLVLYPAFKYLDGLIKKLALKIISHGKNLISGFVGMFLMSLLLLFFLYCVYAHIWFGENVIKSIFQALSGNPV